MKTPKKLKTPGARPTGRSAELRLPRDWPENGAALHWIGATAARGARLRIWTPPTETLLTTVRLPTQSRAKIIQALPYALEDQLIEEPEQLHYAYVREPGGELAVAVTARARLKAWTDALTAAGVRPTAAAPANLALPLATGAWTAAFVNDELWVRTGLNTGFACLADASAPPSMLLTTLAEARAGARPPANLTVYRPPAAFDAGAWTAALGLPVASNPADFWSYAHPLPQLNLLQSEFASTGEWRALARPLLPAIIMLGLWFLGLFTFSIAEWINLRSAHARQVAEMHDIYTKHFPETKTVIEPYAQMQRELESLQARGGGPGDLLPLLTRIAGPLRSSTQIKLRGIKYSERSLMLDITFPDYRALESVKASLMAARVEVEVLAANSRGTDVEGRLRVRPAGVPARNKAS